MATQPIIPLTEQDYLALEAAAEYKSEFVDGEIYAMSGGTPRHARLGALLTIALGLQLRGRDCRIFSSDLKIRAEKSHSYLYPDLSVICGPLERVEGTNDVIANPSVIFEVLSPSTADYDHGKKFAIYREIPTLKDYLLVHSEEVFVEHFTLQPDGSWILRDHKGNDAVVEIPNIQCTLNLKELYDGVFDD